MYDDRVLYKLCGIILIYVCSRVERTYGTNTTVHTIFKKWKSKLHHNNNYSFGKPLLLL